jgi:hypothetical protein
MINKKRWTDQRRFQWGQKRPMGLDLEVDCDENIWPLKM